MLSQYEEMKRVFQLNCRAYWMQRKEMEEMKIKYPGIDSKPLSFSNVKDDKSTFDAGQRYRYLKQTVEWVDDLFQIILNEYGDFAYKVLWKRFIEFRTQADVAKEMGFTRRQIQYEEDKVIRSLMEKVNEKQKHKQIQE